MPPDLVPLTVEKVDRLCTSLGFDGRSVFVPHPILNRTTAEIHSTAETFADEIMPGFGSVSKVA